MTQARASSISQGLRGSARFRLRPGRDDLGRPEASPRRGRAGRGLARGGARAWSSRRIPRAMARRVLRRRLADLGIVATPSRCSRPLDLVGEEVGAGWGRCRVLSIGTDELDEILRSCGHTLVPDADWTRRRRSSWGSTRTSAMTGSRTAARAVAAGAAFFAVNMDARFPGRAGRIRPRLRCAGRGDRRGGRRATDRDRQAGDAASSRSPSSGSAVAPSQAAMVGDSTASDIDRRTRRGDVHDLARTRPRTRSAADVVSI